MVWYDFALRVLAALSFGALIGAERQLRQRMAGLRTNALVATGAALFVTISAFTDDPQGHARIAAQVVSGIGFLGAGVIMREGLNVRGLNTAATLWCSAAVGVLSGLGHVPEAAIGTAFVLAANVILRGVAQRINVQGATAATEAEQAYRIAAICSADEEVHVRSLMLHMLNGMPALVLQSLHSEDAPSAGKIEVRADVLAAPGNQALLEQLVSRVSMERSVSVVRWAMLSGRTMEGAEV
ncbi:MgtC/SapB family protein [Noviherbaspirillum pedocola]|uniref:Protein MgtC n=1 Tax=Noviherbaspirillum pedocola TaxID=2801341 RepID=A0A934SY74_9BURK|nr:MgtC/SapB family protein [Noviherbaspirillum pedocola]MBK4737854.1 MgtC/SapB family protein [Noviherbaspirillum pedocola]